MTRFVFSVLALALAALIGVFLLSSCMPTTQQPTPTAPAPTATRPPAATPTPIPVIVANPTGAPAASATLLGGRVWHDVCGVAGGEGGAPAVPTAGCVPDPQGGFRANGSLDPNEPPLANVLVTLGAGECPSSGLSEARTGANGAFSFTGMPAGIYCVMVNAIVEPNAAILLPGQWTRPASAERAAMNVTLAPGEKRTDLFFGWDYQFQPVVDTPAQTCTYKATYVADVTIPDNTIVAPGATFVKTWRVRNDGNCVWGPGHAFRSMRFVGGQRMGAPETVAVFSADVAPGKTADVSIPMTAPQAPGTYRSEWKFIAEPNKLVGVGASGNPLFALIRVRAGGLVPTRVTFAPGATEATVNGSVTFPVRPAFLLRASAGQQLAVRITSASNRANFAVIGVADGQPLKRLENEDRCWFTTLTVTQDYHMEVAVPSGTVQYDMKIVVLPAGQTNPSPCGGM